MSNKKKKKPNPKNLNVKALDFKKKAKEVNACFKCRKTGHWGQDCKMQEVNNIMTMIVHVNVKNNEIN